MGTVNANFLPATTGLNLGSSVQRWNGFFQSLSAPGVGLIPVSFSASPVFDGSKGGAFEITLTANVTSSSIVNMVTGVPYYFIIIQDGAGGHTFTWPASFKGAMVIDLTASITNVQPFITDGVTTFAAGVGVSM